MLLMWLLPSKCMCRTLTEYILLFYWIFPGFFSLIFYFPLSYSYLLSPTDPTRQLILLLSSRFHTEYAVLVNSEDPCSSLLYVNMFCASAPGSRNNYKGTLICTSEHLVTAVLKGPQSWSFPLSPQAHRVTNGILECLTSPGPFLFPKLIIIPSFVL